MEFQTGMTRRASKNFKEFRIDKRRLLSHSDHVTPFWRRSYQVPHSARWGETAEQVAQKASFLSHEQSGCWGDALFCCLAEEKTAAVGGSGKVSCAMVGAAVICAAAKKRVVEAESNRNSVRSRGYGALEGQCCL